MKGLKEKINGIRSLLSPEQLEKDILEIENNPENGVIIRFLEKIGAEELEYEIKSESPPYRIQEKGGCTYLWYKNSNGTWIIQLWRIKRLVK